jgi:hypothetical protein
MQHVPRTNRLDNVPGGELLRNAENEHVPHGAFESVAHTLAEVIDYIENFYNPGGGVRLRLPQSGAVRSRNE